MLSVSFRNDGKRVVRIPFFPVPTKLLADILLQMCNFWGWFMCHLWWFVWTQIKKSWRKKCSKSSKCLKTVDFTRLIYKTGRVLVKVSCCMGWTWQIKTKKKGAKIQILTFFLKYMLYCCKMRLWKSFSKTVNGSNLVEFLFDYCFWQWLHDLPPALMNVYDSLEYF